MNLPNNVNELELGNLRRTKALNSLLTVLSTLAILWVGSSIPALSQSFTVTNAHGDSEMGPKQGSYQAVRVQAQYGLPSWGKTGEDAYMTISFNANNSFHLLPESEAEVRGENDSDSQWHRVVKLNIGTATFDHSSTSVPQVKLDCETPTAICGAEGTQFRVEANTGKYSVSSGTISIQSNSETGLSFTTSASTVVYAPGKENTYSNGKVNGLARIAGTRFRANAAEFIVSKKLGANSETAVQIISGTLDGTGPGDYFVDGGKLKPFPTASLPVFANYLSATAKEGQISVAHAAYVASRRTPPAGYDAGSLSSAASAATALRNKLFTRGLYQTISREVGDAIRENH